MNFYQHHIGDFNNATRHLTRLERSIYRDLRKCCRMFTSVASHLRVQDVYSAKPPKACASVTRACTLGFAGVFFGEFMSENLVGICSAGRTVAPVKLAAVQGGDSVNEQALHQAYQAAKREWMAANPNATPAMFEAAMQAIAERLGL